MLHERMVNIHGYCAHGQTGHWNHWRPDHSQPDGDIWTDQIWHNNNNNNNNNNDTNTNFTTIQYTHTHPSPSCRAQSWSVPPVCGAAVRSWRPWHWWCCRRNPPAEYAARPPVLSPGNLLPGARGSQTLPAADWSVGRDETGSHQHLVTHHPSFFTSSKQRWTVLWPWGWRSSLIHWPGLQTAPSSGCAGRAPGLAERAAPHIHPSATE